MAWESFLLLGSATLKALNKHVGEIDPCPGVNFTNIRQAAFMHADPKSAKRQWSCRRLFVLLGPACIKAAHEHDGEIEHCSLFPYFH